MNVRRSRTGKLLLLAGVFFIPALAAAQTESVVWRGTAGASVSGNNLTKTAGTGWGNSGAVSLQSIETAGYVEFVATETNLGRMLGLSRGDSDQSYADIDFAIYLDASATVQVYEQGGQKGSFGSYVTGDRFRVEVGPGSVRYRKNGSVFYTSPSAPRFPLLVDTALYSAGATLSSVETGFGSFVSDAGVAVTGRTLTKTGSAGWNAGAISAGRIVWGDGFIEFTATETNKNRAGGLSNGDSGQTLADIDFAVVLKDDAAIEIQEAGTSRGTFGSYSGNDRFRVQVEAGTVAYLRNGIPFYTSTVTPTYPLNADTSFDSAGGTLSDIVFANLVWADSGGVAISGASLRKSGGTAGWNAGAISTSVLASGDGFVEFTAIETDTTRMCGLAYGDSGLDDADIDFAIQLTSSGDVKVVESGTVRGTFGTYATGDRFRVEIQVGEVKYRKNGVVFYSSPSLPSYPLTVDASLYTDGATLSEVALGNFVWRSDVGVAVRAFGLVNTASTGWGLSGAVSTMELQSGDGYVEFTATDTASARMIGFNRGDANQSYTDLDFAIYPAGGTLFVYESGSSRGSFGSFASGDRIRVGIEAGVVKYRRNGTLLYTSSVTPQYPLLVDTAFYTAASTIAEVTLVGALGPPQVSTPTFTPAAGTYSSAQSVAIACATGGVTIRYTTDGSEPTMSSTTYASPLFVGTSTTVKAKAWKAGLPTSETATATYTMNFGTLGAPSVSPASGTYTGSTSVTMSSVAGATIRYTTNGAEPTAASPIYSASVPVEVTSTIKAKAFHPDYVTSATTTRTYTIKVATPTFSPDGGTYTAGQSTTVEVTTTGASIPYTIAGNDPVVGDAAVASGASLALGNFTLKARAFKAGCDPSDVKTAVYTVTGAVTSAMVAAGGAHSVALRSDGTVWTWGFNGYGQLGDGTTNSRTLPAVVGGLTGVKAVAAGSNHTLALKADGTVWAWGYNGYGQLGDGTTNVRYSAILVTGLSGIVAISAAPVGSHSLALKSDGSVFAWGYNQHGQLGDGTSGNQRTSPVQVGTTGNWLTDVVALGAGQNHSLAVRSDGTARAWGYNGNGQLGDNSSTSRTTPVQVNGLSGLSSISGSVSHSVALKSDGTVWTWGSNYYGTLGNPTPSQSLVAIQVAGLSDGTSISSGDNFVVAAKNDGTAWAWGLNSSGQLGDGTSTSRNVPTQVASLTSVVKVSGGSIHSLALTSDETIWAWGDNSYGRLGDGTTLARLSPVKVSEPGMSWKVGTPTLTPGAGSYTASQTVVVNSVTPGATIRYTTNGAEPTTTDNIVAAGGSVSVGQSLTVKAKAWKSGLSDSNVATAAYALTVATPGFTPGASTYNTPQTVTVNCSVPGAVIRYTTNSVDPTTSDATIASGGTVLVDRSMTLKAQAWKAGWTTSSVMTATYLMKVATPTLSVGNGSYSSAQSVVVATATPDATIYYTLNGLDPVESDHTVSSGGTITISGSTTLKVSARRSGWTQSDVAPATYTLNLGPAATPVLTPGGGTYSSAQDVAITTTTPAAFIRYTVDGSEPNGSSPLYLSPVRVDTSLTLKAKAFRADQSPSATASGAYAITTGAVATPTLSPAGGTSFTKRSVTIATATAGATIRYTTDGTEPTTTDTVIASGDTLEVDRSMILKAKAWKSGLPDSGTRRGDFIVTGAIAAGDYHTVVLKADGTVWAWGHNDYGQVGDGTITDRAAPVQVTSLTGVIAIDAGAYHTIALKSDGTVWVWGANSSGQLGDGTTASNATTPKQVGALSNVVAIAAGQHHNLVVKSDGTVWGWGLNNYGQVGDGTTTIYKTSPVQASGLSGATAVAGGQLHSLALKSDGTVWAWGPMVLVSSETAPRRNAPLPYARVTFPASARSERATTTRWG